MPGLPVRGLGKSWRGQPCAYCPEQAAQGCDHIFARSFFPPEARGNLPQAPACDGCAGRKAKLEAELAGALPFAASHPDADKLLEFVSKKIAGNARLQRRLEQQGATINSGDGSIDFTHVDTLEFEGDPLFALFEMIVRGLYYHHWKLHLSPEFGVRARAFPRDAALPALDLFTLNAGARVEANLSNGAFLYQGIRTADNPNASLWRFRILGGVTLFDTQRERRKLDEFLVSTLRKDFWDKVAAE